MHRSTIVFLSTGVLGALLTGGVSAFATGTTQAAAMQRENQSTGGSRLSPRLSAHADESSNLAGLRTVGNSALVVMAGLLLSTSPVNADEYGRESEAQFLPTGETTMICVKRGPLGACTKTASRTPANDNDKADDYFQTPNALVKRKDSEARTAEVTEGNALIDRLKKQTDDNREKNELLVQQKTFMSDKSAYFGPFDRQVLILNENGKGFTLLENPQAMRLKNDGLINKDKQFIRQPTKEELEAALVVPDGPGFFGRIFGGE